MEFQKIVNFLNTNFDEDLPRFFTKKCVDQSRSKYLINQEEITMLTKKLELKHQC